MAQNYPITAPRFETPERRRKLPPGEDIHWLSIARGVALGWRRRGGKHSWYSRRSIPGTGRYKKQRLALSDEHAGGLTFEEALQRALAKHVERKDSAVTVRDAAEQYIEWFKVNRSCQWTEGRIRRYIIPALGSIPLEELTTAEVERFKSSLVAQGADEEKTRKSKATANRNFTILRALLNRAWRNGLTSSNSAWARVQPFPGVDEPRVRYLTPAQCRALILASPPALARLIRAALYTGARYGELARLKLEDFDPLAATLTIRKAKGNKSRVLALNEEAVNFFSDLARKSASNSPLLRQSSGTTWGKGAYKKSLCTASKKAEIVPSVTFHVLRHTWGSHMRMQGVPIKYISEALGHSDTRITEKYYAHLHETHEQKVIRENSMRLVGNAKEN